MSDLPSLGEIGKLAEPLSKSVDAVRAAVGAVYEPVAIVLRAKAEAMAEVIKTKGEIEVSDLKERALKRVEQQEERRQENIENIMAKAALALPSPPADHKPDSDWIHQFFDYCKDVGNDQMQTVWGKLLAGEIGRPGSFSLLTLSTMKVLSKKEADMFTNLCSYVWCDQLHHTCFPILRKQYPPHCNEYLVEQFSYNTLLHLESYGLVQNAGMSVSYNLRHPIDPSFHSAFFHNVTGKNYVDITYDGVVTFNHSGFKLTPVGNELTRISGAEPDPIYLEKFVENMRQIPGLQIVLGP